MRGYLLDTHTLLWYDRDPDQLPTELQTLLRTPTTEVFVSAINLWELGIKYRLGKLPEAQGLVDQWSETLQRAGFRDLVFNSLHARDAASMEWEHRDPFDRALAAQARVDGLTFVTRDPVFSTLPGLTVLW